MKKLISLFATIAVAISLAGCSSDESNANQQGDITNNNPQEISPEEKSYNEEQERKLNSAREFISGILSEEPLERSLTKTHPAEKALEFFQNATFNPNISSLTSIIAINAEFETELVRRTSENTMYSVYRTDEGGFIYAFFADYNSESDIIESLGVFYNSVYVMKSLEMKDFSSLQIGDDISLVERIDPAVIPQKNLAERDFADVLQTKHLLRDGLLLIDYKRSEDSYVVTDMKYYEDFKFEKDLVVFDCSVLESDYPQSIG